MTIRLSKCTPGEMTLNVAEAFARKSASPGPLEEMFFSHSGRVMNKWIHYLPFYDRVFAPYRGLPIRMLEIGVWSGGSLDLWRRYFGADAILYGIDINPDCAARVDPPNQVRIGSQNDPDFLCRTVAEMGGLDIVLDDGSHIGNDQLASFRTLWPLLQAGGLYVIEDTHTSYWSEYEGGLRRPGTAIEMVKQLLDDIHAWHHPEGEAWVRRQELGSIHIADSIVAIEKVDRPLSPGHIKVAGAQHVREEGS